MADDRYLDGDPRENDDKFLFTDLSPFVQFAHREFKLVSDLIAAGRMEEAKDCAIGGQVRAAMLLRELESTALPEVDLDRTKDAGNEHERVYKQEG